MQRRTFLGGAGALAVVFLATPGRAEAARRLVLRHGRTGARFSGIWHDGRGPDPAAMADLSAVLADGGARPKPFDPAAIEILWEVSHRAGLGPELLVTSGYRSPAVNAAAHGAGDSWHLRAGAVDLDVQPRQLAAVAETALRLGRGGVGVYRRRSFVHLDSGPVRHWTDRGTLRAPPRDQVAEIAEAWAASQRR